MTSVQPHAGCADDLPGKEWLTGVYETMLLARRLTERMMTLNRQGRAPFVIGGTGQEAAQVGAAMALRPGVDYLAPYYRDLAMNLVFGMSAREAMLNALAKRDDPNSHGRQMPAHWGNRDRRIVTQSSVVATQLLHAAGIALGAKLQDDPIVVMACCGEGSTSRGDFHEALNFAAIHRLPVIFFVENNGYAITESVEKEMPLERVADRACAYHIESASVDGTDPVAVYKVVRAAVEEARGGGGPWLIEAMCHRLGAHSSDDDQTRYRSGKELEEISRMDPVTVLRARMEGTVDFRPGELEELEARVEEEVRDATQWALMQPDPAPEDALGSVFKDE
jgi:2-oxoisovalerate dehydrogenase E1 component alpha subunit